jgi:hypothetical protein
VRRSTSHLLKFPLALPSNMAELAATPVAFTPDGQPIGDDQLHHAIASGTARFAGGQPVHFVNATGEHYSVPGELAWKEIKQGARPLTSSEFAHYRALKETEQSGLEQAKTAGTGLARTLTFGLSDPLLQSVDPGYAQQEQLRQEAFPTTAAASELAGYALPIAGELGLGGKAIKTATAAPRALSAAARATGEAATKGLTEGYTKRIVRGALEGAVEGAGFGVQQGISDQTVHDEPLTWQRIALNSSLGATLGGLLGGLSEFGSRKLAKQPKTELTAEAEKGKPSLFELPTTGVDTAAQGGKPSLLQSIRNKAADAEIGQTLKEAGYIGGDIALVQKAEGEAGVVRYANRIRNEIGAAPGDSLSTVAEKASAARVRAGEGLESVGNELDGLGVTFSRNDLRTAVEDQLAKLRASGTLQDQQVANAIERKYVSQFAEETQAPYIERERVIKQHAEELMQQAKAEAVEQLQNEIALGTRAGITRKEFGKIVQQQLSEQRESIAKLAKEQIESSLGPVQPRPITYDEVRSLRARWDKYEKLNPLRDTDKDILRKQEMRKVRDALEGDLVRQIRENASPELANRYIAAKLAYKDLGNIADVARKRAGMVAGNRLLGLSEQMAGTGLLAGGVAAGHAVAGGLASLGGIALARLAKSKVGTHIGSELLHRIAGDASKLTTPELLKGASEAAGKTAQEVEGAVGRSTFRLPAFNKAAAYQVPVDTSKGAASLYDFVQHLDRTRDQISPSQLNSLSGLDSNPGMQQEAALTQAKGLQLIADLAPHADQPLNPALGINQAPPPESMAREYANIVHLLDQPSTMLQKFKDGTLTRRQAGIVTTMLPSISADLQKAALTAMSNQIDRGKTPSYQMRLRMGVLTGVPVDPSDTPQFTATVQTIYQQMPMAPQPQAGGGKARRQSKLASRRDSVLERMDQI